MKIFWCREHDEHAATKTGDQWCWRANFTPSLKPCRMVPMRLIPDNAETMERIARVLANDFGGRKWPIGVVDRHNASLILAALNGETP